MTSLAEECCYMVEECGYMAQVIRAQLKLHVKFQNPNTILGQDMELSAHVWK